MANAFHTLKIAFVLLLNTAFSLAMQFSSASQQDGSSFPLRNDSLAKDFSPIGSMDDVAYWQESLPMTQSNARINCLTINWRMARFRNRLHLNFIIDSEDSLDSSWTDAITFYRRDMYTPEVDSSIPISHYQHLALRTDKKFRSLVDEPASMSFQSICALENIPTPNNIDTVPQRYNDGVVNVDFDMEYYNEGSSDHKQMSKALSFLGNYEGFEYWQDSSSRTHDDSRKFCETLGAGVHLATLENKGHLHFLIRRGALEYSWTAYTGVLTRDIFRWGNDAPIFDDIPISIKTSEFGLYILPTAGNQLAADLKNSTHPCLCRERVSAD